MSEPKDVCRAPFVVTDDRPPDIRRRSVVPGPLALALAVGLALGGCAIPFGNGTESTDRSAEEMRRDRNRLYLEEQERMERGRTFDRVGPSER